MDRSLLPPLGMRIDMPTTREHRYLHNNMDRYEKRSNDPCGVLFTSQVIVGTWHNDTRVSVVPRTQPQLR